MVPLGNWASKVALGNGFQGIQKDLGAGTSMIERLSQERQKTPWKYSDGNITSEYSDGKLTSEWMHIDVNESGEHHVNKETFLSVSPEEANCIDLGQGLGFVCIRRDIFGRGFSMQAQVSLKQQIQVKCSG